ncbi:MAG: nucleotidyltransferase domain-containing protein [Leptospirales bacterium]
MAEVILRNDYIDILKIQKPILHKLYGVTRLGVYGSVAREENDADSDIDIVIEMVKPDLFNMVHIKQHLEEVLGCVVDLIHYREKMNPYLKARIDSEIIDV